MGEAAIPSGQGDDPRTSLHARLAELVAPHGPFAMEPADVLGTNLPVYRNRQRSLGALLLDSLDYSDQPYIVTAETQLSFGEHAAQVRSLAHGLRHDHGIGPGDRVLIAGVNSIEWIESFWALVCLGAIAVAANPWWSPAEVEHAMNLTAPRLTLADTGWAGIPTAQSIPVLRLDNEVRTLATSYPTAPMPSAEVAEDDPAVIIFTSGTSGHPKGATHSHRNLLAVVELHRLIAAAHKQDPESPAKRCYLTTAPLFHIAGLHNIAIPRLATGSTLALHLGRFDAASVCALIERAQVTDWATVPTLASRVLDAGVASRYDLSSLVTFTLGAAPSSPELKDRLRGGLSFAKQLRESYGMTETCTGITSASDTQVADAPEAVGTAVWGVELQIRDQQGERLPPGVEGEVWVRSCYNMLGYWRDEAATAEVLDQDRWLRTGDLGTLDPAGVLRLTSRRTDLINRGGENVYPAEVERVLETFPGVRESLVYGVADRDLGQQVAAVVVHDEPLPTAEELASYVKAQLASYKVPQHWQVTSRPLARNALGKVNRAARQSP